MPAAAGQRVTDRVREIFIEEIARSGNISAAARVAGASRQEFYRTREEDPEFAAAWEDAIQQATDRLELEARRRAHDGYEEPVFYQGVEVATVRKYSDQLMIQLLKAHHPAHRETRKIQLGGDPDSPPIAATTTDVLVDAKDLNESDREAALKLAHKARQRGGK